MNKLKMTITAALCAAIAIASPLSAGAHPPAGGKKLPPSKAAADLKEYKRLTDQAEKAKDPAEKERLRAQARERMNAAKKILVSEGRYGCCIKGGCDECALEMSCPCGQELSEGKEGAGVCKTCYNGWQKGEGAFEGIAQSEVKLDPMGHTGQMAGMHGMGHREMKGMFGDVTMSREASGTTWVPDESPMYMKMAKLGAWETMFHGYGYGVYTDQGGKRGDSKLFAATQVMGMATRRDGNNIYGGRAMFSLDPLLIGTSGYPLLFQTGETAHGKPLVDAQHPHDFTMELAGTYARRLNDKGGVVSAYLAPVGEPALGPAAFPHRPSAFDNPEAPLSHHWFDSTHITYGVATLGAATNAVKLEGSIFTGREPDENRWKWDKFRFDSYSGRLTVNPSQNWSAQISHGFLKSPEAQELNTNEQRTTLTASYSKMLGDGAHWQTTGGWARKHLYESGEKRQSDAYLLESAYLAPQYTVFGRYERVDKDELFPGDRTHPKYAIHKFTLGGVKNILSERDTQLGVGASVSAYAFPSSLKPSYGSNPVSFNVFLRVRTGQN